MGFLLKGFPKEVSEYIELPDFAELLSYPMFFDNDIEDVFKYGSDFQKKLIDMTPIRGDKKRISVLCQIKFIDSEYTSCSGNSYELLKNNNHAWHIDYEDRDGVYIYGEETDRVHLLTSHNTCMTEFNSKDIILDWDPNRDYNEFHNYLINNYDSIGIVPQKMPSNKIVTFTNHLHRPTLPKKRELRFMYRVVETDRKRPVNKYQENAISNIISPDQMHEYSVITTPYKVSVFMPKTVQPYFDKDIVVNVEQQCNNLQQKNITQDTEKIENINSICIDDVFLGKEITNQELINYVKDEDIVLVSYGDYDDKESNDNLVKFFENCDKKVKIIGQSNKKYIGTIIRDFYLHDEKLGKICGSIVRFDNGTILNDEFIIMFDVFSDYHYYSNKPLKVKGEN
jgi:hypothetical protein